MPDVDQAIGERDVAHALQPIDAATWPDHVARSKVRGPVRELAAHAAFVGYRDGVLSLSLPGADDHLRMPGMVKALAVALAPTLGGEPTIRFESAIATTGETLHQRSTRERDARQQAAESAFLADPGIQQLLQQHGATVVPDSVRPLDD